MCWNAATHCTACVDVLFCYAYTYSTVYKHNVLYTNTTNSHTSSASFLYSPCSTMRSASHHDNRLRGANEKPTPVVAVGCANALVLVPGTRCIKYTWGMGMVVL